MAFNEVKIMELKEIIRRRKSGQSISKISKATGRDRKTVRKYLNLIEEEGLIDLDEQGKDEDLLRMSGWQMSP